MDAHLGLDLVEQAAAEEKALLVLLQFEAAAVDDELGAFLDTEIDIGRTRSRCWRVTSGPISASGSVRGSTFSARTRSPAQGFGYAVTNLGLGSGGSMIHAEMMQGFRPSGAASEQLTSNF
jgi:hypothetical protein